jgi:hypothetical protein
VAAGHYARHISRWQTAFGDDQIHFLFLDDIKSNPKEVLDQVWEYLGIKPIHPSVRTGEKVNAASIPRFPLLARAAALFFPPFSIRLGCIRWCSSERSSD